MWGRSLPHSWQCSVTRRSAKAWEPPLGGGSRHTLNSASSRRSSRICMTGRGESMRRRAPNRASSTKTATQLIGRICLTVDGRVRPNGLRWIGRTLRRTLQVLQPMDLRLRLRWLRWTSVYKARPFWALYRLLRLTAMEVMGEVSFRTPDGTYYVSPARNFSSLVVYLRNHRDTKIAAFIRRRI